MDMIALEVSQKVSDSTDKTAVAEETTPVIQKIAEGSIEGQVANAEGPVVSATVSIGMNITYTDSKGEFLIEHIPLGIQKVRAKSPTSRFYDSAIDTLVQADRRNELFIFLSEVTGSVEGTVVDESGKPLIGAEVSGLFRLSNPPEIATTDEKGRFTFKDIPRGSYFVRAKAIGHMIDGVSVNVIGGSTVVADFKLKSGSLTITGNVLSKQGAPLGCELLLMRKGIVVTRAYTTEAGYGKFRFENLVPDVYEIGTLAAGYISKGWHGKLEESAVVNFELESSPPPEPPNLHH